MNVKAVKYVILSAILVVLSGFFIAATLKVVQRGDRLIEAKAELESLQQQKLALEKEAEYRQSAEFIEEEARNKLNMVKPGEEVYIRPKILGDDLLGVQDDQDQKTQKSPDTSFISRLFDKLKQFLLSFLG
ncbi:septum formation initiator family protein [Patescibacteria group bacterium]|nr:septum formation initiator family protein [Patescibacteria group bacterium]